MQEDWLFFTEETGDWGLLVVSFVKLIISDIKLCYMPHHHHTNS